MQLPAEVEAQLKAASFATSELVPPFSCTFFPETSTKGNSWNHFVNEWAPTIYTFVQAALGPYGTQPLPDILPLEEGMVAAGANASFNIQTGQIRLGRHVEGNAGMTLEKLTHEMIHGSLALFPEGDAFYEEGFVDYSVYVLAHAPIWRRYRNQMIEAAAYNIECRRDRAMRELSDWDRKRWAGGVFASLARGPHIISGLRSKKAEGNFTW